MFDRRRLLAASAGSLAAAALPASAADGPGQVLTMRFAMKGPQPLTTCFIGQHGPYLMLLDTGNGAVCTLREDILKSLDLQPYGGTRIYGASGTDYIHAYMAHDVVFGQVVRQPDVVFLSMKGHAGIDGVLPLSLFTARPTDMDFTTGEVRIQYTGAVDRTGFRPIHSERVRQSESAFVVQATVDGVSARLVVDTGAATTVSLSPGFVRKHGLWEKHPRYLEHGFAGITGQTARSRLVRSPQVQIGPYRFQDVIIDLADPKLTALTEIDGLLGIDMLRRFTVGFDAGASTLWLKPNDHLADPYPYDHSGLTWDFKDGRVVVVAIAAGSPAETAGIKVGDRLPRFASRTEAIAFDHRLQGEPDTPIPVEIEREGVRSTVTIVLKEWL